MALTLATVLAALSCSQSFDPWGDDSTVVLAWTLEGAEADVTTCDAAGADRVRMSINRDPVEWLDERLQWPCAQGGAYLDSMFRQGSFHVRFDLVDDQGEVLASTPFKSVDLEQGTTEIEDIDFDLE